MGFSKENHQGDVSPLHIRVDTTLIKYLTTMSLWVFISLYGDELSYFYSNSM